MKILFAGGGTGGHIIPIIAVAREIRRIYPEKDLNFSYLGPKNKLGEILLSQEGIKTKTIFSGKIRRYFSFQNFVDILFKIPIGIIQSFFHIFISAPDLIFSKGGYGSLPTVISGWILQVPIFLHESDIVPGLTNRISSRFALEVFVSFPRTQHFSRKKMLLVGNPIRREILEGSTEKAKELFNLTGEKPVVLILGGSQGAQSINDVLLGVLPGLLRSFELIHQCGEKNYNQVKSEVKVVLSKKLEKYYHLCSFLKEIELKHAYRAADLIISRAGSGSIFEIAALKKPSILIPFPAAASEHQLKNAYAYAENGAGLVMEESNLTSNFFLERVKYLFFHPQRLKEMEKGAEAFSQPQAARIIAEYIIGYFTEYE